MSKKIVWMAAMSAIPMLMNAGDVDAQERGDRQELVEHARAASGDAAAANSPTELPPGLQGRSEQPPGILLTRPQVQAPEPPPEGGEPEECMAEIVMINGVPTLVDCNGNVIG